MTHRSKQIIDLDHWLVSYEEGHKPKEVKIPHAWRQDVALDFEGPATYTTTFEVPREPGWIVFEGVSYEATVKVNQTVKAHHQGIWDGFAIDCADFAGSVVEISVEVFKNGGKRFPLHDVMSGFLPFVFHTFGGIFRPVRWVAGTSNPIYKPALPAPLSIPQLRGVLHWGWYPELGAPTPSQKRTRRELALLQDSGFNCVKFCLYLPSHDYLEELAAREMWAWIELPIWQPNFANEMVFEEFCHQVEEIVRQYRHHSSIAMWSIGCELGKSATPEQRKILIELVKSLTNGVPVGDDSGDSGVYGGNPKRYGDFRDFHPYCDAQYLASVLNQHCRTGEPVALGEFADYDVHRDYCRLVDERPYWASILPELNDQGFRWQYDLPGILLESEFAHEPKLSRHEVLMNRSIAKGLTLRQIQVDAARQQPQLFAYVLTGVRDTPISSSGFFDDWDVPRYAPESLRQFNSQDTLFLLPQSQTPWVAGGNQPGIADPYWNFAGTVSYDLMARFETPFTGHGLWKIISKDSHRVVAQGLITASIQSDNPTFCAQINAKLLPGKYTVSAELGGANRTWPIEVIATEMNAFDGVEIYADRFLDPGAIPVRSFADFQPGSLRPSIVFLSHTGTAPAPFWRECIQDATDPIWGLDDPWIRWYSTATNVTLDSAWLTQQFGEPETLLRRVDCRTTEQQAYCARIGNTLFCSLRPEGGLGDQPHGLVRNPGGYWLLTILKALLGTRSSVVQSEPILGELNR